MDVKKFKALLERQVSLETEFHQLVAARDELHEEIFQTLSDHVDSNIVVDEYLYFIEPLPRDTARIAFHGEVAVFGRDT